MASGQCNTYFCLQFNRYVWLITKYCLRYINYMTRGHYAKLNYSTVMLNLQ